MAIEKVQLNNPWGGHDYVSVERPYHGSGLNETSAPVRPAFSSTPSASSLFDVGILRDTLLPSVALHSGLATAAYVAGRLTDRVETKDWLWPGAQIINAWWSAVGTQVLRDEVPLGTALRALSRPERLILAGVTLWGGRLFTRVVRRSLARSRRASTKTSTKKLGTSGSATTTAHHGGAAGFWNSALFTLYLPEALFQAIVSLPFTASFRGRRGVLPASALLGTHSPAFQALAAGLFAAGFALEAIADWQLDRFKGREDHGDGAKRAMCREGVWGIVRHPNYLGDALVHLSFPLMLYASDMLAPVELLGPLANYVFLRFVRGDRENEHSQARRYSAEDVTKKIDFDKYRREHNAFWPDRAEVFNKWSWIVVGCGVAGAVLERVVMGAY
ncbi:hypothetical protein B0T26DRAFT_647138 [Lasiosphaeria miniovina]|uniref:Steroid 5-alpha reductase C-terminal domain-containing protein n=1 Tax=Lasiosphaeria miniovina TaxID=1954250 RepID=A0AA40E0V1_9PEZI|nr:uncharacterized protein B0T26DRAFT_647138 [Lasiosphaeria miniovina]KAK0718548.1 hypothetical protein B0T26DRAFT_647138 [Lasiosphaeria miniovina]